MPRKAKQHRPTSRPADKGRGKTAERGYGGTWRKLRQVILSRDPLCRVCQREPSAHVDLAALQAIAGRAIPWEQLQAEGYRVVDG